MNLLEYFEFLKKSNSEDMAENNAVYIFFIPDDYPRGNKVSISFLLETLKNLEITVQKTYTLRENRKFIGSSSYLKDGADNCNSFLEFLDFIEERRCGYKEYNS